MEQAELVQAFFQMKGQVFHVHLFEAVSPIPKSEFFILHQVTEINKRHEKASTSHLAQCMSVSNPAISRTVKNLVEKDWLVRYEDDQDRRNITLELTEQGQAIYQETVNRVNQAYGQALNQIELADLNAFIETGYALARAMEKVKASYQQDNNQAE
ncbi:MarR family winged helix-turn-helix transcriptional regulator [Vaginisenegalia massiliensis]|uniref:MarR family winged helix-turn-helix transcriptional regulator n=1 Tax=Vaginisenegalia massiliensis TaxID=2058294 RepID=UPI0013DE541F|nr:winged helix DNA-binding protein [Vaginisenegalia massiliensis]